MRLCVQVRELVHTGTLAQRQIQTTRSMGASQRISLMHSAPSTRLSLSLHRSSIESSSKHGHSDKFLVLGSTMWGAVWYPICLFSIQTIASPPPFLRPANCHTDTGFLCRGSVFSGDAFFRFDFRVCDFVCVCMYVRVYVCL